MIRSALQRLRRGDGPSIMPLAAWLWRHRLRVAVAIVVLVPLLLWVRYLLSAERVARATVTALNRGDAATLVKLATRRERELLNLTPETVDAYLRQTWHSGGKVRSVQLVGVSPYYKDVLTFQAECRTSGSGGKPRWYGITVYQDPHGRWRVGLSQMLYRLVAACELVREGADPLQKWRGIAQTAGIAGVALTDNEHVLRWSATGLDDPKPFVLTRPP